MGIGGELRSGGRQASNLDSNNRQAAANAHARSITGVRLPMPTPHSPRIDSRRPRSPLTAVALATVVVIGTAVCGGGSTAPRPHGNTEPKPARAAKWGLEWADEFNGTTLDANTWIAVDGAANVNNELEYYTPSEVYLENGSLVLRSQRRSMVRRSRLKAQPAKPTQSSSAHISSGRSDCAAMIMP